MHAADSNLPAAFVGPPQGLDHGPAPDRPTRPRNMAAREHRAGALELLLEEGICRMRARTLDASRGSAESEWPPRSMDGAGPLIVALPRELTQFRSEGQIHAEHRDSGLACIGVAVL